MGRLHIIQCVGAPVLDADHMVEV
jgi:hypothetical protein